MIEENVSLIPYSNYRIGGPARFFAAPTSYDSILAALEAWRKRRRSPGGIFILGGGTNLLINDRGFGGLVLKPDLRKLAAENARITAEAGVPMDELLEFCARKGLSGLEWAGGLPGTLGGAIRGNAGAFGGEIKDAIVKVTSSEISGRAPKVTIRNAGACRFGYRTSIFKEQNGTEVVLSAVLQLKRGDKKAIRAGIEEKIAYRNARHPMDHPNIGSIFKNVPLAQINADITQINADTIRVDPCLPAGRRAGNPRTSAFTAPVKLDPFPVVPAAYLIAQAGLKGVAFGGAEISPKHPNFIVNVLNARAADVKQLIRLVKVKVKEKYGVALEEEVMYVA